MNENVWRKQPTIKWHKNILYLRVWCRGRRACVCQTNTALPAAQRQSNGAKKRATTRRDVQKLLNTSCFHPVTFMWTSATSGTPPWPEKREVRQCWASVLYSWRSWKVISHQGMTQTSASIVYPGWVNVGTLSSQAWPPCSQTMSISHLFDLCFEFCVWFRSSRLSVVGWTWFIFLLSCQQRRIMPQNSN